MNKKGFTLIELLAVIVILAVIALIATPVVMDSLATARKGAAKNAGYGYIEAVEYSVAQQMLNGTTVAGPITADAVSIKGTKPTSVSLSLTNGQVTAGYMVFNGYTLTVAADGSITTP